MDINRPQIAPTTMQVFDMVSEMDVETASGCGMPQHEPSGLIPTGDSCQSGLQLAAAEASSGGAAGLAHLQAAVAQWVSQFGAAKPFTRLSELELLGALR
jgi:hypothetical protein